MNLLVRVSKRLLLPTLAVVLFTGSYSLAQAVDNSLFSTVEQEWIAQHPSVRVRISRTDPPFEFYKDHRYQGIAYDYLQIVSEKTGIQFEPVVGLSWTESLEALRDFSKVDLVLLVIRTKERESFLAFSHDYVAYDWVIITKKSNTELQDFSSLTGKTIAVERVHIDVDKLLRDIPGANLLEMDNADEALRAVAKGRADAYVGSLASGSWSIEQRGFTNLKVVGSTPYGIDGMAMGVRKDWPELAHIVDTVLNIIPDSTHQQIQNRWLPINYDYKRTLSDMLPWLGVILLVAFLWIVQLRTTVRRRTTALRHEIELRAEQEVELKMSMDHLESTHQRLRFNIGRMPLGYIVWDADWAVSEWNPAAEKIFGWTEEEARGKHAYELVVPEEAKPIVNLVWERLMQGDDSSSSINANTTKDGRQLICSWSNTPLRNSDGEVIGALSMVEDITRRHEEEEGRKQQFELISRIFDSINALVYVADLETFELLYLNQLGQDIFGGKWAGKKCYEYLQSDQAEMCPFCTNDKLLLDGEPAPPYIWEFQNSNNNRWYQCIDRAIPWFNGKFVRMEMAFDITELKQTEQLKDELVSAVSHEMRTPLTAVMGYVEYLMTNQVEPEKLKEHFRTIYREAEKLNELIDSFLNLQQLKADRQPVSFYAVDVCSLLNNLLDDLSGNNSTAELEVACPEGLASIKGDTVQVREAVYRVVNNAIKYSPAGGCVKINAEQSGQMINISITDQGIGIPADALGKIFERFYRVDNSDTREFGGVGIGLSLVHDIVTTHAGQVRAESEEGEGTTVTLSFPIFE